jgi:hypothetical protein
MPCGKVDRFCPLADTPRRPADQGLTRRHAEHLLQEDAVVLLLPTRPYASIVDAGRIDGTLSSQTKSTPRNQGFFTDDAV